MPKRHFFYCDLWLFCAQLLLYNSWAHTWMRHSSTVTETLSLTNYSLNSDIVGANSFTSFKKNFKLLSLEQSVAWLCISISYSVCICTLKPRRLRHPFHSLSRRPSGIYIYYFQCTGCFDHLAGYEMIFTHPRQETLYWSVIYLFLHIIQRELM